MVRVVRSASARVEIPEIGVEIDPGPACEGFVSNVEGVIDRIDDVVSGVLTWAEGEERENALVLRHADRAREGGKPALHPLHRGSHRELCHRLGESEEERDSCLPGAGRAISRKVYRIESPLI